MLWSGSDRLENWTAAQTRGGRPSSGRGRPERRRRALRLVVESLEDRTVLTTMLTVNSLLDDGTAGTLRAVISQANSGTDSEYIIGFDPAATGTITLTQGQLALRNSNAAVAEKAITIEGPGASQLAVSGNNASRVFEIMSGMTATLAGLTITGGQSLVGGGIFNNRGGTVTVTNSTISGSSGSGIRNSEGTVTVTNSTISGNSSGGIFNNAGTVTVTNSTISGNSGSQGEGGGIWNTGQLTVTNSTLSGNSVTNRGGGIYNLFGGTVTVTGSTISRNSAIHFGGGIWNAGLLTVTDSTLSSNAAHIAGGGIYNVGSYTNTNGERVPVTVTVTNSILSGNQATDSGGGIYNGFGAKATVTASTLSGNQAGVEGAGIYNHDATLTVTASTLSRNSANDSGGGIFNKSSENNTGRTGAVTVTNSTLSDNSATTGGGIFNNSDATVTVTNSTLSGNSATRYGGGIYNDNGGMVTATSSTLIGNSATRYGGGIFNNSIGTVTLSNTILAGNQSSSGPDLYGPASSQGHNLIGDTTDSSNWLPSDLTGTVAAPLDPLLGPLQDNGGPTQTMALLPGSPAIDAGVPVSGLTTDQRGIARPQGSAPDIGAFESRGFDFVIVSGGNQSTAVGQPFAQPLVVSVSSRFDEPVDGGVVGFTAPGSGPGTAPPTGTATISQGKASLSAVANTQAGSYVVTASASGASQTESFRLTNTPGVPVPVQVTAASGTPQTATADAPFGQPLVVRVVDQYDNPVPGVAVTFAAPGAGPSASFGGSATFIATTDAAGLATAQAVANTAAGQYVVTAAVAGVAPPVPFVLTNAPAIAPRIVGLQRFGFHRRPTRLVLSFTKGLDPARATAPQNYALFHPGRDGRLGTRDDRSVGLRRVVYDPANATVSLRPERFLSLRRRYTLVVRGTPPGGLADPSGVFLAGAGQSGTDYVTTFGREILSRSDLSKLPDSAAAHDAALAAVMGRNRALHRARSRLGPG